MIRMLSKKRSKRKAKKQAKLEAQRAAMAAAMQGISQGDTSVTRRRPTSVTSLPVPVYLADDDELDENTGSDSDDVSLGNILEAQIQKTVVSSSHNAPSSSVSQQTTQSLVHQSQPNVSGLYTLPYSGSPLPPQASSSTYVYQPSAKDLRRRSSQPVLYPSSTNVPIENFHHPLVTIPSTTTVTLPPPPPPVPATQSSTHTQPMPATTANDSQRNMSTKSTSNGYSNVTIRSTKKISAAPKIDPAKAEQISHALSMGLGRGVDATSKTPWASKGSFQVRRVHNSIVETNEGSCTNCYNDEIVGVTEMEQLLQKSLYPPENPVTISVEAEANRNINSSRRIVGKKVVTRTLSFQTDFEEKYSDGDSGRGTTNFLIPRDPAEVVYNTQNSSFTFEERVCQWLLHRIGHKYAIAGQKLEIRGEESPVDQLAKMLHGKSVPKGEEEIIAGCNELIQGLRTTHYVTNITLGATEYRIMSTGEYHKKLAEGGAFGIDTLAISATGEMIQTKKEATKCSQLRKMGIISEDGQVEKTPQNEVVLTVQLQPITRLIRLPAVKSAMLSALANYMKKAPVKQEGGPFTVKCTGRNIYLTVNKFNNYEVEGTENPEEASLFYFQPTDDGGNPFDFNIVYQGEDVGSPSEESQLDPIGRYLEAPINSRGYCSGPLLMKHCVKVRNTRFTLRSRLSKKYSQSHLSEWTAGEDAFYVACATKKSRHGSYLAIKNAGRTSVLGKHFFMTACLPSIHHHNGNNIMMLFQLVPKDKMTGEVEPGRETPGKLPSPPAEVTIRY